MAKGTNKKVFDGQTLLYSLIDTPTVQSLYLPPDSALQFPQRLVNNDILKNCIPGEETNITRNSYSDMHLFYLKQIIFAALVPDIRLYKVRNTKNSSGKVTKKEVIEIEIPKSLGQDYIQKNRTALDTVSSVQDAIGEAFLTLGRELNEGVESPPEEPQLTLSEKIQDLTPSAGDLDLSRPLLRRAGQIGIKSFEWNYQGQNPFSAERDIQAALTLSMDGMGALNAVRTNRKGQKYRILDVMIQADCFKKNGFSKPRPNEPADQTNQEAKSIPSNQALKYDPGCYEVLIEAGYFVDEEKLNQMIKLMNLQGKSAIVFEDEDIQRALQSIDFKKMKSCMYLNTTDHSFTFGENGKVDVTINYVARSISADRAPEANILLSSDISDLIRRKERSIEILEAKVRDIKNGVIKEEVIGRVDDSTRLDDSFSEGLRKAGQRFRINTSRTFGLLTEEEIQDELTVTNLEKAEGSLKRAKEKKQLLIEEARNSFFSNVLDVLLQEVDLPGVRGKRNRVYSIDLTEDSSRLFSQYLEDPQQETLAAFRKGVRENTPVNIGLLPEPPPEIEPIGIVGARDAEVSLRTGRPIGDPVNIFATDSLYTVPFVFFGDVLDAVIENAGKDKFKDYRYILSNVKIKSPLDETKEGAIPIGAIPITVELLRSVIEKEIKANKRQKYTLLQFIRLLLNKVLGEALGRQSVKISTNNNINFKTTAFLHYGTKNNPDPTATPDKFDVVSLDPKYAKGYTEIRENAAIENPQINPVLLNLNGACSDASFLETSLGILNIVVIHENSNKDFSKEQYGDIEKDFKRFIPHFIQGQPYGLIKKITLEKQDIPLFRETRFEQAGGQDPDRYLTNFYNATFNMIGNDLNTLGSYIYFDPFGLAPDGSLGSPNDPTSLSYIMGLGGVHLITKINHKMTPGDYTTIVKTRWENRGALKQNDQT